MKTNKFLILFLSLFGVLLTSCGGTNPPESEPEPNPPVSETESELESESSESESESESEAEKLDFINVHFESASYTYDGNPHILNEVTGAPLGTTITYIGRSEYVDVGVYDATAKLVREGYNDLTLTAKLTILSATFTGYTYNDETVTYDGKDHINDVTLVGVLPEGTTLTQTVTNSQGVEVTSAIDVGVYNCSCVLTNKNYKTLTLNAKLTIKALKKTMPIYISDEGNIYFANGLDHSFLYVLGNDGELNRVDSSTPKEFKKTSSKTTFIADSLFLDSVKEIGDSGVEPLYTNANIDDFVKQNENIYYFSSNSLTASNSGIYKVDVTDSDDEPVVTKIFEGKSDNLSIYGGYLYFTNGNDNNYIYRMNLTNNSTSLVLNEKVHEYVVYNSKLYCTVNGLINDFIGYVDLSSSSTSITKLTDASGEYLTVKNGYLYYNYTDLFGKIEAENYGVWKINLSNGQTKQILQTESINGFDVETNDSIIYIDTNDLNLYRYVVSTDTKENLLEGFVAPEITPINTGGKTIANGSKIYYLNMHAGKTLYCYDEVNKTNSQLTTNKVEDFYIYNGILYFNQVTLLTNNDLYSVDLVKGGESLKINTNDFREMVSDGTYLYASHYNWAGAAGGLSRVKLDGTEWVKFSEVNGAKNLRIKDDRLYYVNATAGDNGNIEFIELSSITSTATDLKGTNLSKNIKNVKQFEFDNDNIFYIYNGVFENSIRRTDLTSLEEGVAIASSKTNPSEFVLNGDYVYYYSFAVSSPDNAGFYRVRKDASKDKTQELLFGYDETYYATALSISSSGKLYFLNYIPKIAIAILPDAHFYQLNLNTRYIEKIA